MKIIWPLKPTTWRENGKLYISIPFTWYLPDVRAYVKLIKIPVVVGGPATQLQPNYFDGLVHVSVGKHYGGVLQRVNPLATKTTTGCIRSCGFCAVPQIEGKLQELEDWPDLPVICDNNLLAASTEHFDRVIDRLIKHGWADFNQGLDSRRLTKHHAKRLAEIKKPMIRLALDSMKYSDDWSNAYELLRSAGIAKSRIRSYVLIGFNSSPDEAWQRCEWVEDQGAMALPMWFHELNATQKNIVTEKQQELGWNDFERRKIMRWFYKHTKVTK